MMTALLLEQTPPALACPHCGSVNEIEAGMIINAYYKVHLGVTTRLAGVKTIDRTQPCIELGKPDGVIEVWSDSPEPVFWCGSCGHNVDLPRELVTL